MIDSVDDSTLACFLTIKRFTIKLSPDEVSLRQCQSRTYYHLVLNILCLTQFVSSITVREPQSWNMRQKGKMMSVFTLASVGLTLHSLHDLPSRQRVWSWSSDALVVLHCRRPRFPDCRCTSLEHSVAGRSFIQLFVNFQASAQNRALLTKLPCLMRLRELFVRWPRSFGLCHPNLFVLLL